MAAAASLANAEIPQAEPATASPSAPGSPEAGPEPEPVENPTEIETLPLMALDGAAAEAVWAAVTLPEDRQLFLQAIDHSLTYLATPKAADDYRAYLLPAISQDRVESSLQRLRQIVSQAGDDQSLRSALAAEFVLYASVGRDGQGTVDFTGYFEPIYQASRVPTSDYRFPLYRRPPDLDQWATPHPTRQALEGQDGLQGHRGPLAGLELVWLKNRLEAFLVQVQGSAKLQLTDGTLLSVGYAGRTDYPYRSIGQALVADGKLAAADLSLPNLIQHFQDYPADLDRYLPQNQRFIFFQETSGGFPTGSLSVPVTPMVSIATDKALMPPGAPALVTLPLPHPAGNGTWTAQDASHLVLNQDTGGAILGPGRVDLFTGTGSAAGDLAGRINAAGALYFLLLPAE